MYYVYILRSGMDGSKYIGVTKDIKRRLQEHNAGGVKYTKSKRSLKLIWFCCFANKIKAYKFEKYLKASSGYAFTNKRLV